MADTNNPSAEQIDALLDEIHSNEQKYDNVKKENESANNVNWTEIERAFKAKNANFIKTLISSKQIGINAQNPSNGQTLLMYAVIIGNLDLIKAIFNAGIDVNIKDKKGFDALDYAIKFGRYKITEIVFYRTLSGKTGNDLKRISTDIHTKIKEAEYASNDLSKKITKFMTKAVEERAPFDASLLFYAWYFNENSLKSKLWRAMMKTFEKILSDTKDKKGWKWLKEEFINSLIWYLPHPNAQSIENDEKESDKMENTLKKTLFWELLKRVRSESKKQSDLLLKEKINLIKSEQQNDWQKLIKYDVVNKQSSNARQDAFIKPLFEENDLSEDKYPPSSHFSAKKFYDTSIYLNDLMFTANILNDEFQRDMMKISEEIGKEINENVSFRMGPVKTLTRSQTKVENDYISEKWPTSAKILDINRCALQFQTPAALLKFLSVFEERVKQKRTYSIKEVIRCKNGWSVYNELLPSYTDIKLNVLMQANEKTIITEIQLLLDVMSSYKKVAHKLYGIERKFELVYNYKLMAEKMEKFADHNGDLVSTAKHLICSGDIVGFELFESCLSVPFNVFLSENISSFSDSWQNQSFNLLQCIVLSKAMSDEMKCKLFVHLLNVFGVLSNLKETLNSLKKEYENMKVLNSFIEILDIFDGTKAVQRFDGFTLRASKSKNSVFKFVNERISSLYMYGKGKDQYERQFGCLGMGLSVNELEKLQYVGSFIAMSAGQYHCAAINGNGNVFVWGKGQRHVLGLGDHNTRYTPTHLPLIGKKAIMLALSPYHTLILTEQGRVYSFGDGDYGKLGHGNYENVITPKMIEAIAHIRIVRISANTFHSMLVSKDGKVFVFGDNDSGKCGLRKAMKKISIPTIIQLPSSMIIIAAECASMYSVLLSSEGETLSCGLGGYHGHGTNKDVYEPRKIKTLQTEKIKSIATGYDDTLCLNEKNKILSFGRAKDPKQIKYFVDNKIDIGSIYVHCDQLAAVSVDGKDLYVWGKLFDATPKKMDVPNDENIVSVGFGYECMGILSQSNEEFKDSEYVLKDGEELVIKNTENKRFHKIFVRNEVLFGGNEWLQIQTEQPNYSLFPYFGHKFVDNLVMNDKKTMIELIKYSEIDSIYFSDILAAEYFVYLGVWKQSIIKNDDEKMNEFMQKAQKYSFDKMDQIKFKIEDKTQSVYIYVKPKGANDIYLLKTRDMY